MKERKADKRRSSVLYAELSHQMGSKCNTVKDQWMSGQCQETEEIQRNHQ